MKSRSLLNAVLLLATVALLARALAAADLGRAAELLASAGPLAAVALVPYAACLALDAAGTGALLRALGRRVAFERLLEVRAAVEAVHLSLPGGAVVADSVSPFLLEGHARVPLSAAAVTVGGRKWLIMRAHALYIVIGSLAGWSALAACSARLLGGPWLPWLVLASAAVPLGLSSAMSGALAGRGAFARAHAWLARSPHLRRWLARKGAGFAAADRHIDALASRRAEAWTATAAYLGVWLVEALEAWLLLRIVGVHAGLGDAMAIEVGLSLLRSAALFAPAGLGVQDLGYMAMLGALGVPDAGVAGAAFVLLKRGKELAWVALGYTVMAVVRARIASAAPAALTTAAPAG